MRIIILTSILFTSLTGYTQWGPELFDTDDNGLLYPDSVISKLKLYSDSLQSIYKKAEVPVYYSRPQARGHYVRLKENVLPAIEDMKNGILYSDFLEKYSPENTDTDLLITKTRYKDFENEFESTVLPEKYCRQIFYSELLIGLDEPLFSEGVREIQNSGSGWIYVDPEKVEADSFLTFINTVTNKPFYKDYSSSESHQHALKHWEFSRTIALDSLEDTKEFKEKINQAYKNALDNEMPNTSLNYYFNRYLTDQQLLTYYRSYFYIGGSSTDGSPRRHIRNITYRAAKIGKWEVFMKGHLDLLFDNVDRKSDLSLMDQYRDTYAKELLAINIGVEPFLFGTIYNIANPHELHYSGNVRRLGRVLTELEIIDTYKDTILAIIEDTGLDTYNRLLFYYLFLHYNNNIEDKVINNQTMIDLKNAVNSLPGNIASKLLNE